MYVGRDGVFHDGDPGVIEFPEKLESADIGRRYAVEIWSDSPAKEGARFVAEETFDEYPTDEQLYWCFAKYGDGILRIKEECYLKYHDRARYDPEKIQV